jgi:DNA gyrase subunit A
VRGISLRDGDEVVGASVLSGEPDILTVTENGYGKRTAVEDYRTQGRGGLGLISLRTSDKTGSVVSALPVQPRDEIIVATRQGKVIRTPVEYDENNRISRMGRATQGVRVIRLKAEDAVVSVTRSGEMQDDAPPGGTD